MSGKTYLTPLEVANRFMVSPVTVRQWAQKGLIKAAVTAGGHRRFTLEEVDNFASSMGLEAAAEPDAVKQNSALRVLIVDDDEQVGGFLFEFLRDRPGIEAVVLARDGFGAGSKVQSFKPNIILLDLMMPGMNGFDVCKALQSDPATDSIKIIAITGYYSPENVTSIIDAGAVACLPKPIDTQALLELLDLGTNTPSATRSAQLGAN